MKKRLSKILCLYSISLMLICISFSRAIAQPDYVFDTYSLIGGTHLQVGAQYRYTSVKPGVDAIVTITNMVGGAYLDSLDRVATGFLEAFQPLVHIPPYSNGYVEFNFQFVHAGTVIPFPQTEVPVTPIDIDGHSSPGDILQEYDAVDLGSGGYVDYDALGNEITVSYPSGTWVQGKNIAGPEYPGVDTSIGARKVMYTAVNGNVSSMMLRSGADNNSPSSIGRYRSIYFMKFFYPHSVLAAPNLTKFTGNRKGQEVELIWNLSPNNALQKVLVERAYSQTSFVSIGDIALNAPGNISGDYHFKDNKLEYGIVYYRLKFININGGIRYSNVLSFRLNDEIHAAFKIYPTVISDKATVNLTTTKAGQGSLQVLDEKGRLVLQKYFDLQAGENNISVNGFNSLPHGTYVAVVKALGAVSRQKIIIQ
jgi:hypothetical protein